MTQSVQLYISGIDHSLNDYQGIPKGALNVGDNIEIRYPNVAEPRRGFMENAGSPITAAHINRMVSFKVGGVNRVISLSSAGDLKYYNGTTQNAVPGNYSSGITNPNDVYARSRFIDGNQNLYTTSRYGVISLCSGTGSVTRIAGVPTALNVQAAIDPASQTGFLEINQQALTTAQFQGVDGTAVCIIVDNPGTSYVLFTANTAGSGGNAISINWTTGAAGAPVITVAGNQITVQVNSGVSTNTDVVNAVNASVPAHALVTASTSIGTNIARTLAIGPLNLVGGATYQKNVITTIQNMTSIAVGQYIYASPCYAFLQNNAFYFIAKTAGAAGNNITITVNGGAAHGSETVAVVGNAITFTIAYGLTTNQNLLDLINSSAACSALITGYFPSSEYDTLGIIPILRSTTNLANGNDTPIPAGTTITAINESFTSLNTTGNIGAGSDYIGNVNTISGVQIGDLIAGNGIQADTYVTGIINTGAAPYSITMSKVAIATTTAVQFTCTRRASLTLSQNANVTNQLLFKNPIYTYLGSNAAYVVVHGRVETDSNGNTITRLGAPSPIANITNSDPYPRNTIVTATLPKNSSDLITFTRLYRSLQTATAQATPLTQYQLAQEVSLQAGNFAARVITFNDNTTDALLGAALYSGSDQEGSTQENSPPPVCWDMCTFNNMMLYGNVTEPSTAQFTVLGVGAPNGVQVGDTITIAGTYAGVAYNQAYTGAVAENQAARQFQIYTTGTPAQNITNTVNSLIRVINYDWAVPVHVVLLSSSTDLPGQIVLLADHPSAETFTVTANAHTAAYDPALTGLVASINQTPNGIAISKTGEFEAVPALNLAYAGDSSSPILRVIPQRDFVIILKGDGVYKGLGTSPANFTVQPFDMTTQILGPDTAVSFNSSVWMYSNQGIVEITDGGVNTKSIPIDIDLQTIVAAYMTNFIQTAFAIGYESDRKYILCMPQSNNGWAEVQYGYNYITQAFTTWSRNFYAGFLNPVDNKLYFSKANSTDLGFVTERKNLNYTDYVDEGNSFTVISQAGNVVTLNSVTGINVGDVLWQSTSLYSPITAVDAVNKNVTILINNTFTAGACIVYSSYACTIQWKQQYGDNPAFAKQFSEGQFLFKLLEFGTATATFSTDFDQSTSTTTITGVYQANVWGYFPWGLVPWGTDSGTKNIRFVVPSTKQIGSYILPGIDFRIGYTDFKLIGCSISYYNISQEAGK